MKNGYSLNCVLCVVAASILATLCQIGWSADEASSINREIEEREITQELARFQREDWKASERWLSSDIKEAAARREVDANQLARLEWLTGRLDRLSPAQRTELAEDAVHRLIHEQPPFINDGGPRELAALKALTKLGQSAWQAIPSLYMNRMMLSITRCGNWETKPIRFAD